MSALDIADRVDAEYVSKENIRVQSLVRHLSHKKIGDIAELTASAFYPAATDLYESGDVPFVRCVDCIDHPVISHLQEATFERLPKEFIDENPSIRILTRGDLVITKVGSPCYASIVHDYDQLALSRTVLGLRRIRQIDPYYLMIFLRSHYGFSQLLRQRELTIQFQLTLERVREVEVFVPSAAFQKSVANLVREHFNSLAQANRLMSEAENALVKSLGFADWSPNEPLTYVGSRAEVAHAGRFDAQYFHPAKASVLSKLSAMPGAMPLGERIRSVREIFDPQKPHEPFRTRNFDITDALEPTLDDSKEVTWSSEAGSTKKLLEPGDVAISRLRAYLKEIAIVRTTSTAQSMGSTEFIVLRPPASSGISAETLWAFLRSTPVQTILRWCVDGSQHPRFSEQDLLSIPVPDAVILARPNIDGVFRSAMTARADARAALARATRAIEVAIEDGEPSARKFLERD